MGFLHRRVSLSSSTGELSVAPPEFPVSEALVQQESLYSRSPCPPTEEGILWWFWTPLLGGGGSSRAQGGLRRPTSAERLSSPSPPAPPRVARVLPCWGCQLCRGVSEWAVTPEAQATLPRQSWVSASRNPQENTSLRPACVLAALPPGLQQGWSVVLSAFERNLAALDKAQ